MTQPITFTNGRETRKVTRPKNATREEHSLLNPGRCVRESILGNEPGGGRVVQFQESHDGQKGRWENKMSMESLVEVLVC